MKTDPAAKPVPEQPVPLASYVAEFERWMRNSARCQNSKETEDICQEIRLALWEIKDVPATREEARRIFLRMASRFESRAKRQVFRQGALVEEPEDFAKSIERDTERSLALLNALEQLDDDEQWLIKECKIEDRSYIDVARQLGVSDNTVRNRLWRAMTKLLAIFKDDDGRNTKKKSHAVVAPLAFEFTEVQRAAFSAIWRAEGRVVPTYGEGPPKPPPSPPVVPAIPPVLAVPAIFAAGGAAVATVVIALLVVFPASIGANWGNPPSAPTAQKGLSVPAIPVIDDVVPMDYVPPHETISPQASAVSSALAAPPPSNPSKTVPSNNAPSSSQSIDPEELKRAKRRSPRSLPSRKK